MYLKQRGEVLDNRAKHNELQVKVGTVETAQQCMMNQCRRNTSRRTIRSSIQVCNVQTRLEMEATARRRRQRDSELKHRLTSTRSTESSDMEPSAIAVNNTTVAFWYGRWVFVQLMGQGADNRADVYD